MAQKDNYSLLISKLDAFIRKFYLNKLVRGGLYWIGLSLLLFLTVALLENYFYFDQGVRKVLFFSSLGVSVAAFAKWIAQPLLAYFNLGSVISHEQAARIVGDHFGDVKDKLLNVLQLRGQASGHANEELILASINQKSESIKLVPFQSAIDLTQNRKYLRYALPPLLLLLVILFAAPSLITESTNRLINNNKDFERPAPFQFALQNEALKVAEFEDFPLTVKVAGDALPNEVFIEVDDYEYRMTKKDANTFEYTFTNVQKQADFRFFSGAVESKGYQLEVLRRPNIVGFTVDLDYPAYVGRRDESLNSVGDLVVPAGTKINWTFNAEHTDDFQIAYGTEARESAKKTGTNEYSLSKRALSDAIYKLFVSNQQLPIADSIRYSISVVPDQAPSIAAETFADSANVKVLFFAGEASDDYGLQRLTFNYRVSSEGSPGQLQTKPLAEQPKGKATQFRYTFDLEALELKPGDEVSYYFEIFDNDAVNGAKSARTNMLVFNLPTLEEYEQKEEQSEEEIKKKLEDALKESKKLQEELKKQREKLLQKKELDWQDKKELEKLLDRQKELAKKMEEAKKEFQENMENQKEFSKPEDKLQEKQEQLQKLMEETMTNEMQELMEQIQELMQDLEKDEALEKMAEMEMNDEQMELEMDRMLELFKKLEFERDMEQFLKKIEDLAEKQEDLAEETEKTDPEAEKEKQEELKKEQEEINEEFDKLQEEMEKLEEQNEELESPEEMEDQEEEMEDIEQDMEQSEEQMEKKDNKGAAEKQKSAAQKMKKMAGDMKMQMESQEQEKAEEDLKALRQLLENLVALSFDQEDLMERLTTDKVNTPLYVDLTQQQFKLKDDFKLIEDSLVALSKRVVQIESFVLEKVGEIRRNMREGIDKLEDRKVPDAQNNQQRTMKNVNDLALMLSETMEQMQKQMSGMMPGNQMCNNPGGSGKSGKVPSDKISDGQKSLNEMMKEKKKGGEGGKGGDQPSSKDFAEMAARQAALRKALRAKQQELQGQGKGASGQGLQELLDEMNKIEKDLVNKKLTNEMMNRQQDIITRLLEHEKAEQQREYDDQRKSKTADNYERKTPPALEDYLKKRESEADLFKTVNPALQPYYKQLVEEYYQELRKGKK